MPDQKSLRAQLGINRRRFKPKVKVEDKQDFDWRPNQQKPKKEGPKAFSQFTAYLKQNKILYLYKLNYCSNKCVILLKLIYSLSKCKLFKVN